ncbi:MAG: hypothetical protein SNJ62_03965 [Chloracidobacterium sp.]
MNKTALIEELKTAYQLVAQYEGGYSGEFFDAREFAEALKKAITLCESGDDTCVRKLWLWFAPTTAWDDFVGSEGMELGNSIFEKLEQYMTEKKIKS